MFEVAAGKRCDACGEPAAYEAVVVDRYLSGGHAPTPVVRRIAQALCASHAVVLDERAELVEGSARRIR